MKKTGFYILCLFFLFVSGVFDSSAETHETMPESYTAIEDHLSQEIIGILPEDLFSSDAEKALSAASSMTRPEYLFRVSLEALGLRLHDALSLLGSLLVILCLAALLHRWRASIPGGGEGVTFFLRLCLYAFIVSRAASMVTWLQTYFSQLSLLMTGFLPLMGTMYAMGGNIAEAATNEGILQLVLSVCQYAVSYLSPAVFGVSLAFALLDVLGDGIQVRFSALGGLIKKWYTTFLGFVMFLLSVALSTQSILSARADSLGMKGLKYAVGQMIPVVGGAVSGTLGTVAAGIELIRGISGVCGLMLIALLLLPTLVQLFLFRLCYQLSATVATMMGCDGEAGLLREVESLYGYMIAAVGIVSLVCVLALAIFAHGASAVGGV